MAQTIHFLKMHGLGNDFVVVDARGAADPITPGIARAIGDRHLGIGFDQLIVIKDDTEADALVDYWNSDGSMSGACGNGTRCVARLLMEESGRDALNLRTGRGVLACLDAGNGLYAVNMGAPQLAWQDIPLARDVDTLHLPIDGDPVATGMGNPHCTFFVDDAEAVDLEALGPTIEYDPLYPERTNVQFAHIIDRANIRMRVWERGVGVTMASGSSSCATTVAAARRGLTGRTVTVHLDGGTLGIDWREDGVWMTGSASLVASGEISAELLAGAE